VTETLSAVARDYLTPPGCSFWRWADNGQALTWEPGQTIVFTAEFEEIIETLAPDGLPPMGALTLLLAACRDGWRSTENITLLHSVVRFYRDSMTQADLTWPMLFGAEPRWFVSTPQLKTTEDHDEPLWELVSQVLDGLDNVTRLGPELRGPTAQKAALAWAMFESAPHKVQGDEAAEVLQAFKMGFPHEALTPDRGNEKHKIVAWTRRFINEFIALHHALCVTPVSAERLTMRGATGLTALPEAADIDIPPSRAARALLTEWQDDEAMAGLARVASDLMAVVSLPRDLEDQDELPAGGVSDIINRGDPHRLIISELAYDDLTLAVRITMNEALYYRREHTPRNPVSHRKVLVDTGLRMWGLPRVFAASVALAMAATADESTEFSTWHTSAGLAKQVNILTREGMIALLESLEVNAHPGEALAGFLHSEGEEDKATDRILITHEDVLADPDFRQCLASCDVDMLYVASVGRQGHYTLQSYCRLGRKVLRQADLDLDCILKAPPASKADVLVSKDHDPALPIILSVEPFPLRISHNVMWDRTARYGKAEFLAGTNDGRIMQWFGDKLGAHQVTDHLPTGHTLWAHPAGPDTACLVIQSNNRTENWAVTVDIHAGSCLQNRIHLAMPQAIGACMLAGKLCLIGKSKVTLYSTATLDQEQTLALPSGVSWVRSRFFRVSNTWLVLGVGEAGLCLEEVPHHFADRRHSTAIMLGVFEREGMSAPWAVYSNGHIRSLDDADEEQPFVCEGPGPFDIKDISEDGDRLVLTYPHSNHVGIMVDLPSRQQDKASIYGSSHFLESNLTKRNSVSTSVRRNLNKHRAVGLDSSDRLCIMQQNSGFLRIGMREDNRDIRVLRGGNPRSEGIHSLQPLKGAKGPLGTRYMLRKATWADGSTAWIDSRGLIHLKSSDHTLPEITMVFPGDDAPIAAWSSDGLWYGRTYFVGHHPVIDGPAFYEKIEQFTRKIRQAQR